MKRYPKVSIVIPAYNEESRLPESIQKLENYIDKNKLKVEIIIVVEKSGDRTLQAARQAIGKDQRFRLIDSPEHKGKGHAVKTGILEAAGDLIFFMDADLSTDLSSLHDFINYLEAYPKTDIIIGSRAVKGSKITQKQNIVRQNMGKVFNVLVRRMLDLKFHDTQCGFKAFRKDSAHKLFSSLSTNGFAFDVEILYRAQKNGYRVKEYPVEWSNSKDSRVGMIAGPSSMFWDILKIRFFQR